MRLELRAVAPGKREERPGILAGCRAAAFPHPLTRRAGDGGLPARPVAPGVAELAAATALHPYAVGIAAPGAALDAGRVGHLSRQHGVAPRHLAAGAAVVVAGAVDLLAAAVVAAVVTVAATPAVGARVTEVAAAAALDPHAVGIAAPGLALDAGRLGHLPGQHRIAPRHLAARAARVVAGAIDFLGLTAIAITLRLRVARGEARGCEQRADSQHDLERDVHDGPSMTVVVPPR